MNEEKLMNEIDFEKIHAYMVLTNWTYRCEKIAPDIIRLKKVVSGLVQDIKFEISKNPNDYTMVSTGGFNVSYSPLNNRINIDFVIESKSKILFDKRVYHNLSEFL